MKKHFVTVIAMVIVLLATPFAALAQSYSFSLDKENVIVLINEDGFIYLDYTFVFTNDTGAHAIDFIDIGMPNSTFDIDHAFAQVNDILVDVSVDEYQGSGSGFAVVLGAEAIQPGQTGTVQVRVGSITSVLNSDSQDAKYTSFEFTPTWFGSDFVHGKTDLTMEFHLPPGTWASEPRFHMPGDSWTGDKEPAIVLNESDDRTIYIWHDENANGYTPYVFGASFPLSSVPVYATELARPTLPPPTKYPTQPPLPTTRPTTPSQTNDGDFVGWFFIAIIIILIIGAGSFLNSAGSNSRMDYAAPQISIEGYGIKRGLTAVEAAVALDQPLDKVLTMILFGIVKKGAAKIVKRDPLQLEIAPSLPEDLRDYERSFLDAFRIDNAREREEKLQGMFIDLIKLVSEKLKGFSKDETQLFYRGMMQRAWQQVREAGTPEVKNQEFDQSFDWLMLDRRFGENVQELFADSDMRIPQWWSAYDQNFKLPDQQPPAHRDRYEASAPGSTSKIDPLPAVSPPRSGPVPTAKQVKPSSSALPGADYAASIVNSVQDFSSRAISDMGEFTNHVHDAVNLQSIYSHWGESRASRGAENFGNERGGASKSDDGFFSLFGSSGSSSSSSRSSSSNSHRSSSSGSRHSSCACACAGCACACAGGGR